MNQKDPNQSIDAGTAAVGVPPASASDAQATHGVFHVTCLDETGREVWRTEAHNLWTTLGKNHVLDTYLAGAAYTAAWFMGLISSVSYTALAVGDTAAQINGSNGWKEANTAAGANTPTFSQANRPAISFSAAAAGSKATSANVVFNITGTGTVKGLFLSSVNTLGGTTGVLFSEALFTGGDMPVASNYTLNIGYTASLT